MHLTEKYGFEYCIVSCMISTHVITQRESRPLRIINQLYHFIFGFVVKLRFS